MPDAYTPEEVAKILKISKYTVYELVKRGELKSYRIGKKMRIEPEDLEQFIHMKKQSGQSSISSDRPLPGLDVTNKVLTLSGSHDFLIEHLVQYLSKHSSGITLQANYIGSLEGLMMLHRGACDMAAVHLLDKSSGEYNIPFIERIFIQESIKVVRLASRNQGFIVAYGNPRNIKEWKDLTRSGIRFVNRQKGSGTRFLLDTHLQRSNISPDHINGYEVEEWNHFSSAACVARGSADVALGIKAAAQKMGLTFIPLAEERFDLIMKPISKNEKALEQFYELICSSPFKESIHELQGYDCHGIGEIIYEKN